MSLLLWDSCLARTRLPAALLKVPNRRTNRNFQTRCLEQVGLRFSKQWFCFVPYPPQLLQHRAERVGLLWEIKSLSTGRIRNLLPTIRTVDQGETDGEGGK